MQEHEKKLLVTVAEAARLTNVGRSTAYRLTRTEWPVVRFGRATRIHLERLEQWILSRCSNVPGGDGNA